MKGAHL